MSAGTSATERLMLRVFGQMVPAGGRAEWMRTWQAELWHARQARQRNRAKVDLTLGLVLDAVWLRAEAWRCALRGTATLCLLVLAAGCVVAGLVGFWMAGNLHGFESQMALFLVEAPAVVFVSFATTLRRHVHHGRSGGVLQRMRRQVFLVVKSGFVLTLGFLASADLAVPSHAAFPLASGLGQTFLCVLFSIAGLRWAMLDQQERCKHCLLALAQPCRVGRPSHNLLEWAGTEQICRQGHGMLSSPEMETSWCSHSQWLERVPERPVSA